MAEPRKLRVFLCYAPQDRSIVRTIHAHLTDEEWVAPWFDEENLLPGMSWEDEVENAVAHADAILST